MVSIHLFLSLKNYIRHGYLRIETLKPDNHSGNTMDFNKGIITFTHPGWKQNRNFRSTDRRYLFLEVLIDKQTEKP